jgi:hypothetical protein
MWLHSLEIHVQLHLYGLVGNQKSPKRQKSFVVLLVSASFMHYVLGYVSLHTHSNYFVEYITRHSNSLIICTKSYLAFAMEVAIGNKCTGITFHTTLIFSSCFGLKQNSVKTSYVKCLYVTLRWFIHCSLRHTKKWPDWCLVLLWHFFNKLL